MLPKWSLTGLCYFYTLTRGLAPILPQVTSPILALAAWWKAHGPVLTSSWYFLYNALLFFFSVLSVFVSNKVTSDLTDNIRVKTNPWALPGPGEQRVKLRTGKAGKDPRTLKMHFPYFLTLLAPITPIVSHFTAMASLSYSVPWVDSRTHHSVQTQMWSKIISLSFTPIIPYPPPTTYTGL